MTFPFKDLSSFYISMRFSLIFSLFEYLMSNLFTLYSIYLFADTYISQ